MEKKVKISLWLTVIVCIIWFVLLLFLQKRHANRAIGWGDNSHGRQGYTQEAINAGVLEDTIVFNSVSDGKIGDEKNFVGVRLDTGTSVDKDNIWNGNDIMVQNGEIYLVQAFVHNNSRLGYDGISNGTRVAFNIPTESATSIPVYGFISSDNASPSEYWDGVLFKSNQKFHLEYLYGSALLENSGIGASGLPLSDEIVTKAASNNGILIGYDALDGNIPGGEQYASYVTIKVMIVFDSDYTV